MSNTKIKPVGPMSYENWKAIDEGRSTIRANEYPIYTDARITGERAPACGPYEILNGYSYPLTQGLLPSIFLRVDYADENPKDSTGAWDDVNDSLRYHGGSIQDEIAALISLCLGIRARAGASCRVFRDDYDLRGRPTSFQNWPVPTLLSPRFRNGLIIPSATEEASLYAVLHLSKLNVLAPDEAVALVLAARTYQNALWLAESEPEMAWLLLVSAIETAAVFSYREKVDKLLLLSQTNPALFDLLTTQGSQFAKEAADLIPPSGVKQQFKRFLMENCPPPPKSRPDTSFQLNWDREALGVAFGRVYDHRSKALHTGKAIPLPMCEVPSMLPGDPTVHSEIPISGKRFGVGGSWKHADVPMCLHIFEHIVRGALLEWWLSMIRGASSV